MDKDTMKQKLKKVVSKGLPFLKKGDTEKGKLQMKTGPDETNQSDPSGHDHHSTRDGTEDFNTDNSRSSSSKTEADRKGKGLKFSMFKKISQVGKNTEKGGTSSSKVSDRSGSDRDIESAVKVQEEKDKRGKRNMASLNSIVGAQLVYCGLLIAFMALSRTQTISPYYKNFHLTRASIFTLLYFVLMFGFVHHLNRCGFTGTVFLEVLCWTVYLSATLACVLVTVILLLP